MLVPRDSQKLLPGTSATGLQFQMGDRISGPAREPFHIGPDQLAVHLCVLGQSGSGKSKFLEQMMRYLMVSGCGFALIDPHGDLSEDLLAYVAFRKAAKKDKALVERTHYLEPSFEQIFHYDPFRFRPRTPIAEEDREAAFGAWLDAKADRLGEIVQRKQGDADFQGMARLQRNLKNVLTAVGTVIDRDGRHLPLADALVLVDVDHPRHEDVFQLVSKRLNDDVLSDFHRLRTYRRVEDRIRETESTVNRLRSLLSPLVRSIFSDHVATIDFASILQKQEVLLVNLRETDYFSADQSAAIGGMFIHEILSAAQNAPRAERKPFYLIVDEAADFIGADIQRALGIMRKFGLSICLAAQDLSSFKKGELDLRPKVLSQCGTLVSFRQTWPEDVDILVRVMGTENLDFKKYEQVVDRPDGYEFVAMDEHSESQLV